MTLTSAFHMRFREAMERRRAEVPMKCIVAESGYSLDYIRRVIRGDQNNPSLLFVEAMAGALGVSVAWLLGLEDNETLHTEQRNVLAS